PRCFSPPARTSAEILATFHRKRAKDRKLWAFQLPHEADSLRFSPLHPETLKEAPMLDKSPNAPAVNVPNDLAAHWMTFTAKRSFKKNPRLLAGAKDMHYFTVDGRKLIDAAAGMWCCNAGHGRSQISSAIGKQAEALDYAPPFQFGIPQAFELATRIADLAPAGLD